MQTLRLLLLGKPAIYLDEEAVTNIRTNKVLALLCYLAATQQSHERQALANLLWSNETEKKANGSLRVALSNSSTRVRRVRSGASPGAGRAGGGPRDQRSTQHRHCPGRSGRNCTPDPEL